MEIKKIATLTGHNGAIFALANGEANHYMLSGAGDGWVVQWDLNNPDLGRLIAKADATIYTICFIQKKQLLVLGDMNGGIHWIPLATPEKQKNILHHKKGVFALQYIDNQIFSIGGDGVLTKWSVDKQLGEDSIQLANQSLRCLAFCKQRNEFAVGASDRNIYILNSTTLEIKHIIENAHSNSVFSLAYRPDGKILMSGGRDAMLCAWDCEQDFTCVSKQPAHLYTINAIVYHHEGHIFATGSRDKTLKIWDATTFQLLKVIDTIKHGCHINSINTLYWSPFNHWLVSGSDDRSLMIWEI
jgi:WD40 repeat protein